MFFLCVDFTQKFHVESKSESDSDSQTANDEIKLQLNWVRDVCIVLHAESVIPIN